MKTRWKVWTHAKSGEKAERVVNRLLEAMGQSAVAMTVSPYEKIGGFVVEFWIPVEVASWTEVVFNTLDLMQRAGRSWTLTGSISNALDATSRDAVVAGVAMLHCVAAKGDAEMANEGEVPAGSE